MNLAESLLEWYKAEGRSLPWREDISAYKVWLSEIIMQQTKVEQGLPYFNKFYSELPTIADFASSDQANILRLWQGLGYYSRARNMHHAAQQIMEIYDGVFPETFEELKKLKGVGDYTAAAITSIVFGHPKAVVDGNVYRVLSRLYNVEIPIDSTRGKKYFQELADELIDRTNPGDYNQAIMDFGAMVCTPKNPNCVNCLFNEGCEGVLKGRVDLLPVKSKKVKVTDRYFDFFEVIFEKQVLIHQRLDNDIWKGLFQLPSVESNAEKLKGAGNLEKLGITEVRYVEHTAEKKHILSHQRLYASFYKVVLNEKPELDKRFIWVDRSSLGDYAMPKLITNYLSD